MGSSLVTLSRTRSKTVLLLVGMGWHGLLSCDIEQNQEQELGRGPATDLFCPSLPLQYMPVDPHRILRRCRSEPAQVSQRGRMGWARRATYFPVSRRSGKS